MYILSCEQIISGSFLTDKKTNCLVEAEMYGLPADTDRHNYTKKAPAPHPFWNEEPHTSCHVACHNTFVGMHVTCHVTCVGMSCDMYWYVM